MTPALALITTNPFAMDGTSYPRKFWNCHIETPRYHTAGPVARCH